MNTSTGQNAAPATTQATTSSFNLNKNWSGHDMSTFKGRLSYFFEVCGPWQSFHSTESLKKQQAELRQMEQRADDQGNCQLSQDEQEKFRRIKMLMASSEHQDLKEIIPWHMRSSAFIPTNLPIFLGMILSPPTQKQTFFWQWINQTYNAGFNYGNRNASSTQTTNELLVAYSKATVTAVGIACGLRALAPFIIGTSQGTLARLTNYFIGYCAVATSSSVNVVAMRERELETGIGVRGQDSGEDLGLSKAAAKQAITDTVVSRVIYCIPMFFVPALWNMALTSAKMMPSRMGLTRVLLESMGVALGLYIAMPVNCALFPQMSKIAVDQLEPEIQERAKAKNLTHLIYNKGL